MSQQIKGSSSKLGKPMEIPVSQSIRKKKSSKTSDSDADSIIIGNKNNSKESLSEDLVSSSTISFDSARKAHSGKKEISVSVKSKKRSPGLERHGEKERIKRRHIEKPREKPLNISIKTANAERSEIVTIENLSERDSTTKKAPQENMLKWLESPSTDKPSSSQTRSLKSNKSSEATPKKFQYVEKRRTKKISKESVSSQKDFSAIKENSLKSAQNIMSKWLSPLNSTHSDDKTLFPEKVIHDKKKRHKPKKETANFEDNFSEKAILSGCMRSPSTNKQSSKSIDVKPKTKSCKDKEKPPPKPKKTMSLDTLENLSQDKLGGITMQEIFGADPPILKSAHLGDKEKILPSEKIIHDKKKQRKRKKETAKSEDNLSEKGILSGWLRSPLANKQSSKSIDVKPKTKSGKDKEKPPPPPKKTMSLDTLENVSQNKLGSITMQEIFGADPPILKSTHLGDKILSPEKIIHDKKKRRKRKKETAKSEDNLPEKAILSGWLRSPSPNRQTSKSIDVKPKTKSHKDNEKPPTNPKKTMSLDTLENLSKDKLRNITLKEIFGADAYTAPTANHWLSKTAAKENISKPRKKRKKAALDIDDLPTFQANLPEQSESFKKYGVVIPTAKEILADRKEFLIYKALVEKAKVIPLLPNPFDNILKEPVKPTMKLLDCKHLSLEVIKEHFIKNKTILENIKNGTQYSEKHQKFQQVYSGLPYNPSNLVFTYQQINCMANLIREEFDPKEKHLRYTFSVLIPELCLLIFMDTHKMSKEETVKYLDERPID